MRIILKMETRCHVHPLTLIKKFSVGVKARTITAVAFILMMSIVLGACTAKAELPVLREAPDFALTNQDGLEVRLSDLRGRVVVMDFIFTSCPDVCGRLNNKLKTVQDGLNGELKQDIILISVSFDPEVDTPEVLKRYATERGFDAPAWQFLTGTAEQIRQVADNYGMQYELVEDNHEGEGSHEHDHRFSHDVVVVLIDQEGMIRKTYGHAFFPDTEMTDDITSLLK